MQLIAEAVRLVLGYNPVTQTVASYADDQLGEASEDPQQDPAETQTAEFLRQVLYGCVRYKEPLKIFLVHLFSDLTAKLDRKDYTLYMVLAFLLLFRIDELTFHSFAALIADQNPTAMCELLHYITHWETLEGQLMQDWCTVYDGEFVRDTMIGGLKRAEPQIIHYCEKLERRAYGMARAKAEAAARGGVAAVEAKPLTVIRPFNLTKPNPRKVSKSSAVKVLCAI